MSFVHDDPAFGDLIRSVADKHRLSLGLVEKDYWVTHTLWALLESGFELSEMRGGEAKLLNYSSELN